MQDDLPDVGFMIREDVSENILAELMAELERTDIRFDVRRTPASPMMVSIIVTQPERMKFQN